MRTTLLVAGLILPSLLSAAEEGSQNTALPEIKATIRFRSDSYGIVPDDIDLPASTLLEAKQRRVIEGDLGRLPIRMYVRETPNQPRPAIEVNLVNKRTNQTLTGYPARQDVGPLGMLSLNVPLTGDELETLVHTAKKSVEGKLGKVDGVTLHIDVDIPVNPEKDSDDNPILDCEELLRQDGNVVDDVSQKINNTSNAGVRAVADIYTGCLNKQTDTLINQLKADDRKTMERIRKLLPDLAPVSFDSAVNANGGSYFSMLSLAGVGVDSEQAETLNRLAKQDANVSDLKQGFQSDLTKAKAALKEIQEIAAKLPDNSATLLAQSSLAILETPLGFQ